MRKVLAVAALAAAVLATASPAAAQGSPVTWAGSIYGGYAAITEDGAPGGSVGFRGNAFAMFTPVLGAGVEIGYHMFGSDKYQEDLGGDTYRLDLGFSAFQATAQVQARAMMGTVRPFATGGLGVYAVRASLDATLLGPGGEDLGSGSSSDTETKFGFNLGGGIQFKPGPGPVSFGIEGRWHQVFDYPLDSAMDVVTVMAGVHYN